MSKGTPKKPVLKKVTSKSIDADNDVPFAVTSSGAGTGIAEMNEASPTVADDPVSQQYIGAWNRLVSQTNWDKGRIIVQWRQSAIDLALNPSDFTDEVWSRKVEGVTAQHVGRLRRVFTRFGEAYQSYAGLYWSHFMAAIDWDDAEMWLEGASRSEWSVSQMRGQRWQARGSQPNEDPQREAIVAVDTDDGYDPMNSIDDQEAVDREADDRITSGPLPEGPDFGDAEEGSSNNVATAQDEDAFQSIDVANPFAELGELPDDVADALEQMKLSIVRHRCRDWEEFARTDMLRVVDALKRFVNQPG
jgi:hypothetical protein